MIASEQRAGVLAVVSAYSFWGVTPIYYKWVEFAGPLEVSAHRIVWALLILAGLVALRRQWHGVRRLTAAEFGWLAVSGGLLFINWLTFVWALQNGRIVETSLGYYINPLITVALGVVFLGERLRWPQTAALALAGAGVVNEVVAFGALPWAGLTLAITFGFYGLVRKRIRIDSAVGLGVETGLAVPLALALFGLASRPFRRLVGCCIRWRGRSACTRRPGDRDSLGAVCRGGQPPELGGHRLLSVPSADAHPAGSRVLLPATHCGWPMADVWMHLGRAGHALR